MKLDFMEQTQHINNNLNVLVNVEHSERCYMLCNVKHKEHNYFFSQFSLDGIIEVSRAEMSQLSIL